MFCSLAPQHSDCCRGRRTPAERNCHAPATNNLSMTAELLIGLLEEMMDLKLQQYAELNLKVNPEVSRLLHEKRDTDRRRLEQIRRELVRFLEA